MDQVTARLTRHRFRECNLRQRLARAAADPDDTLERRAEVDTALAQARIVRGRRNVHGAPGPDGVEVDRALVRPAALDRHTGVPEPVRRRAILVESDDLDPHRASLVPHERLHDPLAALGQE